MANDLLKALTIDGVTNEVDFPEFEINTINSFSINTPDSYYGGATVTLKEGYYYAVVAGCWFGSATSTSLFSYQLWLAKSATPTTPWLGGTSVSSRPYDSPRLNAVGLVKMTPGDGDAVVGAYANVQGALLSGNKMTIVAIKLGKVIS